MGTHIDCLPNDTKRNFLKKMESTIRNKYDKKGFPIVSGYIFVSSTTGENMDVLRTKIHGVAEHMNDMCSSGTSHGKMVGSILSPWRWCVSRDTYLLSSCQIVDKE